MNLLFENLKIASLRSDVDKLDIDKLVSVLNGLNSLKSKVDNLDPDKLKTASIDLEELTDVVDKDVLKIAEFNVDEQGLNKKIEDVDKTIPNTSNLFTNTALNTKIGEVEDEITDANRLVVNTTFNKKMEKLKTKFLIIPCVSLLL